MSPNPLVAQGLLLASYGSSASNTSVPVDAGLVYGDVLFAFSLGLPIGLSATNYYWFEIVEDTVSTMAGAVAVPYASGRITTTLTRHASAAASEFYRMSSSSGNTFVTHQVRVKPSADYRYIALRMRRAAAVATVPLSAISVYVSRRRYDHLG